MSTEKKKEYPICKRCGRKLKNPEYRKIGMGKTCLEKSKISSLQLKLFD